MAALTVSQCRAFLADRLAALFPDDSVYNARIRPIPSDRLPWSRVDITAGRAKIDGDLDGHDHDCRRVPWLLTSSRGSIPIWLYAIVSMRSAASPG